MRYIKIKYFPADFFYYLNFLILNLLFLIIFIGQNLWLKVSDKKEINKFNIILLIPKTSQEFEERKDLIFNQLSLNKNIISVDLKNPEEVKLILSNILTNIELDDDLIPEVYELKIKNKNNFNLESINYKVSEIDSNAKIFTTNLNKNNLTKFIYVSFLISSLIFILVNSLSIRNNIYRIKDYLAIGRAFGVRDYTIIKNMNLGHFTIIVIAFLLSILVFYFYLNTTLDLKNYYSNFLYIFFTYTLVSLVNFNFFLIRFLKIFI